MLTRSNQPQNLAVEYILILAYLRAARLVESRTVRKLSSALPI